MVSVSEVVGRKKLAIIVLVSSPIDDKFKHKLKSRLLILSTRYSVQCGFVAASIKSLGQSPEVILKEVGPSFIIFSGRSQYVGEDSLSVAKRSGADLVLFCTTSGMVENWIEILKKINEIQETGTSKNDVIKYKVALITRKFLLELKLNVLNSSADIWLETLCSVVYGEGVTRQKHGEHESNFEGGEFYCTDMLIRRIGSLKKLNSKELFFDGVPLSCYKSICVLISRDHKEKSILDFDALSSEMKLSVVGLNSCYFSELGGEYRVDIVPGRTQFNISMGESSIIEIARQICEIKRGDHINLTEHNWPAVVVMSNFNKQKYIASSIFSILNQTYSNVKLRLIDDSSLDYSLSVVKRFFEMLNDINFDYCIEENNFNLGTYWIRNKIIFDNIDSDSIFFVNDSDDISCAQRLTMQIAVLKKNFNIFGCFMNVVRVDDRFATLRLDSDFERYGTASLAFRASLIAKVGYFENIKKNADTEFIERCSYLLGKEALIWDKQAVLYQVFDGKNLTADIYSSNPVASDLVSTLGVRSLHLAHCRKNIRGVSLSNSKEKYAFPISSIPMNYGEIGSDFLINCYKKTDNILILTVASDGMCKKLSSRGFLVFQYSGWRSDVKSENNKLWASDGIISSDLNLESSLVHHLTMLKFHGYLVLCSSTQLLDKWCAYPGGLISAISKYLLMLKKNADKGLLTISTDEISKANCTLSYINNLVRSNSSSIVHSNYISC